jgi:hypothetical protein
LAGMFSSLLILLRGMPLGMGGSAASVVPGGVGRHRTSLVGGKAPTGGATASSSPPDDASRSGRRAVRSVDPGSRRERSRKRKTSGVPGWTGRDRIECVRRPGMKMWESTHGGAGRQGCGAMPDSGPRGRLASAGLPWAGMSPSVPCNASFRHGNRP